MTWCREQCSAVLPQGLCWTSECDSRLWKPRQGEEFVSSEAVWSAQVLVGPKGLNVWSGSLWAGNGEGKSKQCVPHTGDLHHLLWHVDVSVNVSSQWASLHWSVMHFLSTDSYGTDKLASFKFKCVFHSAKLHSCVTVRMWENVKTKSFWKV